MLCDDLGHYSYECNKHTNEKNNEQNRPKDEFTGYVITKDESSDSEDIFFIMSKTKSKFRNDNEKIDIIIDKGASKSVISQEELNNLARNLNKSQKKMLEINQQQKMAKFKFDNVQPIEAKK